MAVTKLKHDYRVVYTPIEDGWIMASVPELPGAITQGRDIAEARMIDPRGGRVALGVVRRKRSRHRSA